MAERRFDDGSFQEEFDRDDFGRGSGAQDTGGYELPDDDNLPPGSRQQDSQKDLMNAIMGDELEPRSNNNFDLNDDRYASKERDQYARGGLDRLSSPLNEDALQSLDRENQ